MQEVRYGDVSVALCTFNGEKYIAEQLESILNQTHVIDEIIICDDGSTDKTIEIATKVLNNSSVKYRIECSTKQLGVTKNFEKAISLCSGDIIFTSDQDDIWFPQKVESILECFDNRDVVLAFSDANVITDGGQVVNMSLHERIRFMQADSSEKSLRDEIVRLQFTIHGCLMAFRRDFVLQTIPFRESLLNHDAWIMYCASLLGTIHYRKEALMSYRIHGDSVTQGIHGQETWKTIVESGSAFSRRFSLNKYRQQRSDLIRRACELSNIRNSMYLDEYRRYLEYYDRITFCEKASILQRICAVCSMICNKTYCYRFMDRNRIYSWKDKCKLTIADILFMIRE